MMIVVKQNLSLLMKLMKRVDLVMRRREDMDLSPTFLSVLLKMP